MKVGLYFGTFNPIHVGHLIIANYMVEHTDLDQVWLVVSPHNPHKEKKTLLADYHRLALVRVAIEDNYNLKASDIEFGLPVPSYTSVTLAYLKEKHPEMEFSLIMGEDNLRTFHKWKNYEEILDNHAVFVYPRVITKSETGASTQVQHENIVMCSEVPVMNVSSSFIRNAIKEGKEVKYLLTPAVEKYVDEMNFYR
ncbi:MAG: nicotinate (nicotinamide) nucleotide adenylyltransferase [Crocinitomicaceae bacterium]|nr:nicotinate (nicotinamide) nucleotide adenylyltransferase [Crocinitomicaceae bacterium]